MQKINEAANVLANKWMLERPSVQGVFDMKNSLSGT